MGNILKDVDNITYENGVPIRFIYTLRIPGIVEYDKKEVMVLFKKTSSLESMLLTNNPVYKCMLSLDDILYETCFEVVDCSCSILSVISFGLGAIAEKLYNDAIYREKVSRTMIDISKEIKNSSIKEWDL